MAKLKNVPLSGTSREERKVAKIKSVSNPGEHWPSWRFSTVDLEGPFAWPVGEPIEANILEKLKSFDSMCWHEVGGGDHHAIELGKLSKQAQTRLQEIRKDDIDEIFSFHFSGKKRIIGIRDMNVVKLLWWDPDHQVCISYKKHT